jgi:hypothetical protein
MLPGNVREWSCARSNSSSCGDPYCNDDLCPSLAWTSHHALGLLWVLGTSYIHKFYIAIDPCNNGIHFTLVL